MNRFRIICLVLFTALLTTPAVFAKNNDVDFQSYPKAFNSGDIAIQAGVGFIHAGAYGDQSLPVFNISADVAYPVADLPFSFGILFGYTKSEEDINVYTEKFEFTYEYYIFAARAASHIKTKFKNLDPYIGIALGYEYVSAEVKEPSGSMFSAKAEGSYIHIGAFAGARYFFTDNIAAFAELGYGLGLLNIGATFKF